MAGALSFLTRGALCFSSSIDFSLCFVSIGRIIASESQTGVCATLTPMLFRTQSAAVYGVDADLVDIEVDLTPARGETDQTPAVIIVGLPDLAVRESRERIRAAINNSAFFFPFHKTTINLAPADVRKERSEEHTSELQSQSNLVCRLLLEKKNNITMILYMR